MAVRAVRRPGAGSRAGRLAVVVATLLTVAATCTTRWSAAPGVPHGRAAPARAGPSRRPFAGAPAADPRRAAIRAENARPGTTAWRIPPSADLTAIEGYADRTSVRPGEAFDLFVSTGAASWTVTAYRMGWYAGRGGREVWRSPPRAGGVQPAPVVSPGTRTVTAPWRRSLRVRTAGWPPGDYLLLLRTPAGGAHYLPVTVRSPDARGALVLMASVLTWQAYNAWGGYDLYAGPDGGYGDRSLAVSFDRPYAADGATSFRVFELPLVQEAERLGLPVAYLTDVDVSRDPGLLAGARAVVSPGHDEYWTGAERAAVVSARDAGADLAFFGANAVYWQVRLARSALGPARLVVCYKTDWLLDPVHAARPERSTGRFRDLPRPEPEQQLTGDRYDCFPADGPYVVADPRFWAFAGSGVRRGTSLPGLVGVEIDRAPPAGERPADERVVAHSPVGCGGRRTFSDTTYYVAPSGARVIDVGTMRWTWVLAGHGRDHGVDARTVAFVRQVTARVLTAFAASGS